MRILISLYTGLGNYILRIPTIRKIKELYSDSQVDAVTGTDPLDDVYTLASENTEIDQVFQCSQGASLGEKLKFFKQLKKQKYDAIFLPFDSKPRFLILGSYLAGIPLRVMHEQFAFPNYLSTIKKAVKLCLLPKTFYVPTMQGRHEIDLNYDLLEAYINTPFTRDYDTPLPYTTTPTLLNDYRIRSKNYIIVQLSARHGFPTPKTWNPIHFKKLIKELRERYPDSPVVTVGSQLEYDNLIKEFVAEFPCLINTAGKTTLNEVIALIAHAKLVIAHDSGLMHVTNAVNTPLIALYGPTDFTRTRPLGENSHILYSKNQHFAKMYNYKMTEDQLAKQTAKFACMDGIKVDDVLKMIGQTIGG